MCGGSTFGEKAEFLGTTRNTEGKKFGYARCALCGSINSMSNTNPDYTGYATGSAISGAKAHRFVKFLRECGVKEDSTILDYGCGNGALVMMLHSLGFRNAEGYEPFNKKYQMRLKEKKKYDLIYMTHVFEHIIDYEQFFRDLSNATRSGSLVITIHPSSTRIPRLNPDCPFQRYALHAPFHNTIPSDQATVEMFCRNGYALKRIVGYDIQRSGIKDNNRVTALLSESLGGIKENWLGSSARAKASAVLKSPIRFFDSMFIHRYDTYVSTMVLERSVTH